MSITPSADTARLIEELAAPDALRRETAIARLSVIGARAVTRLLALAGNAAAPFVADHMEGWQPGTGFTVILGESVSTALATSAEIGRAHV